ncbi:glycosyltransferase family 39 protein, partial [candidate division KSB1 bacterium]|nr:glycosyltransferase family 39 protein [candidate division KSB1 bacterium]
MALFKTNISIAKIPKTVAIILFVSLFVRLFFAASLDASFDETYYYAYSLRPSLSYFDHPPMVALMAGFFPAISAIVSPLSIRMTAILLFSIGSLLLYFLAEKFMQQKAAVAAFAFIHLAPMLSLGAGTLVLPDGGLFFCWVITLWLFF